MALQVFISYKSEYRDFARTVKKELNAWGFDTWLDVDNIQPGDYFRHKIQEGLDSSDVLLMVLTQEAQLSREVMAEVDYFLDIAKKPVVPLRHRECKPLYIFVSIQYIDFVSDQSNGFVQLKQRLNELASTLTSDEVAEGVLADVNTAPPKPIAPISNVLPLHGLDDAPSPPGAASESPITPEPIPASTGIVPTREESRPQTEEKEHKKDEIEDGLFDLKPQPPSAPMTPPLAAPITRPQEQPAAAIGGVQAPTNAPTAWPDRQQSSFPQPATRSKPSPVLWPLAAAATLVLVVGAVLLLNTTEMITSMQQPQTGSPWLIIGLVALVGTIGFMGWRQFSSRKTSANPQQSMSYLGMDTNRNTMLNKVEAYWLKGVLEPALEAGSLEIGLAGAPGAVLRHKDYGDYELAPNANILDVFNDLNRELLILGTPGGGKTVLLLQLGQKLIEQARQDSLKAIPVVLNLSSWAAERKPLADWLADELRQKYQMPKRVTNTWIEQEKLLLLLDGLDEVAETYRNTCVDAINTFRQRYRSVDVAVCSRMADYDALTAKLDLRGAVVLEPLSQPVIDAYLSRPELASLRQMLVEDTELKDMSKVPFLLNAMAYAYTGISTVALHVGHTSAEQAGKARRTHLFDHWVQKRLLAKPADAFSSNARNWLGWLASKIVSFKRIVFYIEELHPLWLEQDKWLYQLGVGIVVSLVVGLPAVVIGDFIFGLGVGLVCGLLSGLVAGFIINRRDITLAETLRWKLVRSSLLLGLAFGIVFGLAANSAGGAGFGLVVGVVVAAAVTFVLGLQTGESIIGRSLPNQGIKQSAYNALRVMLAFGLVFGLAIGLVLGVALQLSSGITIGRTFLLAVGLEVGVVAALFFGGADAVIKHIVLRFILWRGGNAPLNYARFLDYCVNTGLMRKVGGGYIFAHRYLLEYFAEFGQEK